MKDKAPKRKPPTKAQLEALARGRAKSLETRAGRRSGPRPPETNMEIAVLARKRVRAMFRVLNDVAVNNEAPASARVSACKAVIDYAKIKPADVAELTQGELEALAKQIAKQRLEEEGLPAKKLLKDMDKAADAAGKLH